MYDKIPEADRAKIKEHVPKYVASTPDVQYRKNPQTYINGKCWNDEILTTNTGKNKNGTESSFGRYQVEN